MISLMLIQRLTVLSFVVVTLSAGLACRNAGSGGGSEADVKAFLTEANDTMLRLGTEMSQAGWVQNTYITPDTEAMGARASEAFMTAVTRFAKRAAEYDNVELPSTERRQLAVLKNALTMAAPADPKEAAELAQPDPGPDLRHDQHERQQDEREEDLLRTRDGQGNFGAVQM